MEEAQEVEKLQNFGFAAAASLVPEVVLFLAVEHSVAASAAASAEVAVAPAAVAGDTVFGAIAAAGYAAAVAAFGVAAVAANAVAAVAVAECDAAGECVVVAAVAAAVVVAGGDDDVFVAAAFDALVAVEFWAALRKSFPCLLERQSNNLMKTAACSV